MLELDKFEGQEQATLRFKESILLFMTERVTIPHTLLLGSPGTGKTSIAKAIAEDSVIPFEVVRPPITLRAIENAVLRYDTGDFMVLFIDEIHTMNRKQQDELLVLLEEREVMANGARVPLPGLTVIAATTDEQMLAPALKERFGIIERLHAYTDEKISEIGQSMAAERNVEIADETMAILATASGGIPRRMRHLVDEVRRMSVMNGEPDPYVAIRRCNLTPTGLTAAEAGLLAALQRAADSDATAGVGAANLQAELGVDRAGLLELEYLPISRGLCTRTRGGRKITREGKQALSVALGG